MNGFGFVEFENVKVSTPSFLATLSLQECCGPSTTAMHASCRAATVLLYLVCRVLLRMDGCGGTSARMGCGFKR